MNVIKLSLIVTGMLLIAFLSGCEEGYSRQNTMSNSNTVAFQPTGTGFWHPGK